MREENDKSDNYGCGFILIVLGIAGLFGWPGICCAAIILGIIAILTA